MKKIWSNRENEIFIELYPNYTNKELIEFYYPDMTEKQLWKKANYFKIVKSEETRIRRYKIHSEKFSGVNSPIFGIKRSDETKKKLSLSHIGINNGKDNPNWQGGISELYEYLRRNLLVWKIASMKECNYKCVITGERFDEIHHTYSFMSIIRDTLENLSLPMKVYVNEYSDEDLSLIEKECLRIHMDNLGVCLKREIHQQFHSIYSNKNNTPEQFEEFKNNYLNNEVEVVI